MELLILEGDLRIFMFRLQRKSANFLIEKKPNTSRHTPLDQPNNPNPPLKKPITLQNPLTRPMRNKIKPEIDHKDKETRPDEIGKQVHLVPIDIIVVLLADQVVLAGAVQHAEDEPAAEEKD